MKIAPRICASSALGPLPMASFQGRTQPQQHCVHCVHCVAVPDADRLFLACGGPAEKGSTPHSPAGQGPRHKGSRRRAEMHGAVNVHVPRSFQIMQFVVLPQC